MTASAALQPAFTESGASMISIINDEVVARQEVARRDPIKSVASTSGGVVDLPQYQPLQFRPSEFFAAIQEWEGVVTDICEDGFTADLWDLNAGATEPSEIAEISFEDIDPQDIGKVQKGALFRWLIGHSRTRSGESSRKWVVYFRPKAKHPGRRAVFESLSVPQYISAAVDASLTEPR